MATVQLTDTQKELVERLGVAHDRMGMPPAASRIMALLTVADTTELTFEDIHETLNLSKSSTSNAINMLIAMNRVEYITRHGERKRYFRAAIINMEEQINSKFNDMLNLRVILREIAEQRPSSTADFNQRLNSLIAFMEFMQQELPMMMERWKQRRP